jgi:hypothetical protein
MTEPQFLEMLEQIQAYPFEFPRKCQYPDAYCSTRERERECVIAGLKVIQCPYPSP